MSNKILKLNFGLLVILTLLFILIVPNKSYAASQAITITPTTASPVIDPGDIYKGNFQVVNQGEAAFDYTIYTTQYRVSGQDYTPDFTNLPNSTTVDKWFEIEQTQGTIKPGSTDLINYTISVPVGTEPGGYYGAIFAQTKYPKSDKGGITLNQRVGEIFYIQVAGPVVEKGRVLQWTSKFLQKPPLGATLLLENTGGLHYPAKINVIVRDIFGHAKYTLNTTKEVLPQTIRKVSINWDETPSIGLFKVTGSVDIYGKTNTLKTQWVLVMSQKVRNGLIIALVLIVIIVVLHWFWRRKKRTKAKRNA